MSYFDQVEVNQWLVPSFILCMTLIQFVMDFEGGGYQGLPGSSRFIGSGSKFGLIMFPGVLPRVSITLGLK